MYPLQLTNNRKSKVGRVEVVNEWSEYPPSAEDGVAQIMYLSTDSQRALFENKSPATFTSLVRDSY